MGTKLLLAFIFLAGSFKVTAQPEPLSPLQRQELLALANQLFEIWPDFEFSLSNYSVQPNFQTMKDTEVYDNHFLANFLDSLKNDPLNPLFNFGLGTFYQKNNDTKTAANYFQKAFDYLDIKYLDQDSAKYYSFRGFLKIMLRDQSSFHDFEKALSINPSDSLAIAYYYPALYASGQIKRLRRECGYWLEQGTPVPQYAMLYLIFTSFTERLKLIIRENENRVAYRDTSFETFYDYEPIRKYAVKYAENNQLHNAVLLGDTFLLLMKGSCNSDTGSVYRNGFEYPPDELQRISAIQQEISAALAQKKLNEYSALKALGYTYLMQNDYQQAISSFKQGIASFPIKKLNDSFNPSNCYSGLNAAYAIIQDTTELLKSMEQKFEQLGADYMSSKDYLILASYYYHQENYKLASEYVVPAIAADRKNYKALALKAQLFFQLGNITMFFDYIGKAVNAARNDRQGVDIMLQFAIYQIYYGDQEGAAATLKLARGILGSESNKIADTLEQEFLANR
ncbi:tetratricopeptide repeat protein [Mangrovibacterium diazotrophicum]|uniref:Tetratricopeptide repeat protein n=1 Tax=Mangrovibacterium diazotrophicum TaxID=1261403 RepID=A0A419W2H8_9BACT|nr:hypothetical protein [Mangrovibacterium diazotrophicum]RKD89673.1 hypothetical protein BC643_0004 [Mangrovibacterium diazotrophicum]